MCVRNRQILLITLVSDILELYTYSSKIVRQLLFIHSLVVHCKFLTMCLPNQHSSLPSCIGGLQFLSAAGSLFVRTHSYSFGFSQAS
jgi:F0F1-type ATP synthase assembly protein I